MDDGTISSPEALYKFLRESRFKVLTNIIFAGSPGHQMWELDYFLRKYAGGDTPREGKYLWIQRAGSLTEAMVDVFQAHFRQYNLGMIARDDMFSWATMITQMVPELGVDVGLSHIKYSVASREGTYVARFADNLYYHLTNDEVIRLQLDYYRLRELTLDFDPWTPAKPPIVGPLADLLGDKLDKIAVVHFRKSMGNSGTLLPPENLSQALEFLHDSGYTVVKGGTEPYPEFFSRYGVINYSESPLRSFRNDIALLSNAKIALINASGLENIPDMMGVPVVAYGRWHANNAPFSSKNLTVPALIYDPSRKRLLSFAEQILFYKTRHEFWEGKYFGWHFPIDRFIPRVPQADEILAGVHEALALAEGPRPLTPLQQRFVQLDENGLPAIAQSRLSDFFLERFQALL